MAIAVKLDDLLHDRRMTLTELADRVGMTLANLSILKTGKARAIRFSTLEAICGALSCQPGDILRFEPDAEREPESNKENFQTVRINRRYCVRRSLLRGYADSSCASAANSSSSSG